jgi:predicted Zn-dependent protease with MMP-like domain
MTSPGDTPRRPDGPGRPIRRDDYRRPPSSLAGVPRFGDPSRRLTRFWPLLHAGDTVGAGEALRAAAEQGGLPPALEADARYALGRTLAAAGEREGMTREWLQVLSLDAAADRPPLLDAEEFEAAAEAALDELPQALIDELQATAIIVVDRPSADMVGGGIDPRILGLYHGVPLNRRSAMFGAPFADTIHLFRANLERVCPTRDALLRRIRVVVLHETAHFFGYTERQLREMGLA